MSAAGVWNLVVNSPMGEQSSTLTLEGDGAALSGTMTGAGGQSTVENGREDGDAVSWTADITSPMALTLEFSGKVEGDAMTGKVKLGMFGESGFQGTRA